MATVFQQQFQQLVTFLPCVRLASELVRHISLISLLVHGSSHCMLCHLPPMQSTAKNHVPRQQVLQVSKFTFFCKKPVQGLQGVLSAWLQTK